MSKSKLRKSLTAACFSAAMVVSGSSLAFGAVQALPNGSIVNIGGVNYLTDAQGERYSGWFMDTEGSWYYFNPSDKAMKTGWHHDEEDGYWYYLNPSDGRMVDGWQAIDGKEYFFQPIRNMGNYYFSSEEEKWIYSLNSNLPYGAMYTATTTPDGRYVGNDGAEITAEVLTDYPVSWEKYTGTFCSESLYNQIMENAPLAGGVEQAAKERLNMRGYEYISIHRIEGNHIYGELHMHGSFDDWNASFQGVEISNTGNFQITVDYEEQGNSMEVVEGLRDSYSDKFTANCTLTEKDGHLLVLVHGESKYPSGTLEQLSFIKVMDEVIRE